MAFYSNGKRILNLPEQVEKNAEDIAGLNQKSEYADTNITNLRSQTDSNTAKISTLETNTTSSDGTITTGSLDVKSNATFGKVIVNSADDITDKDGNAIVKNESLEEFKTIYYSNGGIGRYSGGVIAPYSHAWRLPNMNKFTKLDLFFSGATIVLEFNNETFTMGDIGIATTSHLFYKAKAIKEDLTEPDWNIVMGNGTSEFGYWMFDSVANIKSITVAKGASFLIKNTAYRMFAVNPKLEEIGAFDFSGVDDFTQAFFEDTSLKHIHCTHFKVSFDISSSTAFEQSDLVEIISNLDPVATPQTLTMGATNLAKLTQEQILVATGKGWTLS